MSRRSANRGKRREIPVLLHDARELGRRILVLEEERRALWERLTDCTSDPSQERVSTSPSYGGLDAYAIVNDELKALRARYTHAYTCARNVIAHIRAPQYAQADNYRDVLTNRYLTGMTARKSAETMNYSPDYERELHRGALAAFEQELKKAGG